MTQYDPTTGVIRAENNVNLGEKGRWPGQQPPARCGRYFTATASHLSGNPPVASSVQSETASQKLQSRDSQVPASAGPAAPRRRNPSNFHFHRILSQS